MNRRDFLKTLATGATVLSPIGSTFAMAAANPIDLIISKRTLDVNGKPASVFGLTSGSGAPGLVIDAESAFNVRLINQSNEETLIHWHGLTPPWDQDGVPGNPAAPLGAGTSRLYDFPLSQGGTHWMHAHTLQEQELLAAPLIVRNEEDRRRDEQDVVLLLHDFSFKSPEELLADLQSGSSGHAMPMNHGGMSSMMNMHGGHQMGMNGSSGGTPVMAMPAMDLNDIEYDAYLANDRALDDPELVRVDKGGRIRLRVINAATATAFTIDTGSLEGQLIAVDGMEIEPISGRRFPLSMGQRADIRLQLPAARGAFPVLALREGAAERTGIILATVGATVQKLETSGAENGPVLDLSLEGQMVSLASLPVRSPDLRFGLMLSGDMASYKWQIEPSAPLTIRSGQRVQVTMHNMSMMAHPMHLHGHHFQVVAINGTRINGAVRDTVFLPPMAQVAIEFDAQNPGRWPLHCHHLYHMATGMMSFVEYEGTM